jgi:hypothetical protein
MRRRKSIRETKNMIQTALWLPRDMHERLKRDGGERGLGDEIRRRVQCALTAAETPSDEITAEVLDQLKDILRDHPEWHADRFVYGVVRAAMDVVFSRHQPSGEGKPETKAHLRALYGQETSEAIGKLIGFVAMKAYARERAGKAFLEGPKG